MDGQTFTCGCCEGLYDWSGAGCFTKGLWLCEHCQPEYEPSGDTAMTATPDTPSGLTRYKRMDVDSEWHMGEWVRYSDVAALEAENRRLREALQAMREASSEAWNTMHSTAYALRDDEDREHLVARLETAQRSLSEAMWNKGLCAALSGDKPDAAADE